MKIKEHLKDLLEYSHHYNVKLIEKFNDGDLHLAVPKEAVRLLSHILNAQKIWNLRMENSEKTQDVWQVYGKEEMLDIENENFERTLDLLEKLELDSELSYSATNGEAYVNKLMDIIFHLVNHSTYHRGQIAAVLRKAGLEPVASDFILYKR